MKEILKNLVESVLLPEDRYIDAESLTFFVEEIYDILQDLDPLISQWSETQESEEVLITIRRHFHTLKGSGRMVGALSSAELAWTAEDLLNRIIAKNLELTQTVQSYIEVVFKLYQFKIVKDLESTKPMSFDLRPFILIGQRLQYDLELEPVLNEQLKLVLEAKDQQGLSELECFDLRITIEENERLETPINTVLSKELNRNISSLFSETLVQSNESVIVQNEKVVDEVFEIFLEEAEEHLKYIDQFVSEDQHTPDQYNRLARALHTLRGSSAMADVQEIARASTQVEEHLKEVFHENTKVGVNENALLIHYIEYVRDYLHLIACNQHQSDQSHLMKHRFEDACHRYNFQVLELDNPQTINNLMSKLVNLGIDELLDVEFSFRELSTADCLNYIKKLSDQAELLNNNSDHNAIVGIHEYSAALKSRYDSVLSNFELLNSFEIVQLFELVHQEFIHLFDILATGQRVTVSVQAHELMNQLEHAMASGSKESTLSDHIPQKQSLELKVESADDVVILNSDIFKETDHKIQQSDLIYFSQLIETDKNFIDSNQTIRSFDEDVLVFFIEEAEELIAEMNRELNLLTQDLASSTAINTLMRHLHTLKGGANMVQAEHLGLISHELESVYESCGHRILTVTDELVQALRLIQDEIAERIHTIQFDQIDYPATNTVALIKYLSQSGQNELPKLVLNLSTLQVNPSIPKDAAELEAQALKSAARALKNGDNVLDILIATETNLSSSAKEIETVEAIAQANFVEEAEDLISEALVILPHWSEQRTNRSLLLQLQRIAHSLKGGAKLSGLAPAAEISVLLETVFEHFAIHNFNAAHYDEILNSAFHWLKFAIIGQNLEDFASLKADLENILLSGAPTQTSFTDSLTRADLLSSTEGFIPIHGDGTEPPSMLGEWSKSNAVEQSEEMIRVSADLIEKMIDLSGENAINRSRIEMDLNQLGHTLTDMELAIKRLSDQLRQMDGELESQIHAKYDVAKARDRGFDPLEMDQYSSLNQLSKSLAESASDLVDFKSTLAEKIKDTESVLLQQSRIQAELQEGLMRARLVPFSRLLPRFQRLVRQVSNTLNKPTELIVSHAEGELDRTILEKLITPLEHMLRNALDHGIETANERIKRNKPVRGKIELDVSRQGSDILVAFIDDGQGIDVEKIRAKAIHLGLISVDQDLSDEEVIQFIFHPGFSTAEKITHISGRGVGLDVVLSSIKSLGGEVSVSSVLGEGSTFTIRVPTSVAVSDALMVKVADQQFAIPLSQIERIVRIEPAALTQFFASRKDYFDIDSLRCKLRHLAEFVGQDIPEFSQIHHSVPVLLIKGNMGKTTALVVDQLIGSRSQIVMKPIGEQFTQVDVLAGATILGDGQVCLILDGQQIARRIQVSRREMVKKEKNNPSLTQQRRLVMIVDDSVTVRKVTTRLLERYGYQVITAKDGIDAIEQLENITPDLMLLDIEMPRMDGFEVTSVVRHHQRHQNLPIIMITSRVGEKHRERAFNLGVNHYMGKPFHEAQLLEYIDAILEVK